MLQFVVLLVLVLIASFAFGGIKVSKGNILLKIGFFIIFFIISLIVGELDTDYNEKIQFFVVFSTILFLLGLIFSVVGKKFEVTIKGQRFIFKKYPVIKVDKSDLEIAELDFDEKNFKVKKDLTVGKVILPDGFIKRYHVVTTSSSPYSSVYEDKKGKKKITICFN